MQKVIKTLIDFRKINNISYKILKLNDCRKIQLQHIQKPNFSKIQKKNENKNNINSSKSGKNDQESSQQELDLNTVELQMKKTIEGFKQECQKLKLGRVTSDMFSELKVKAYGEIQQLLDLCQTQQRGQDTIIFQVFDESIMKEFISALENSKIDLKIQKEGKNVVCQLQGANTNEAKEMLVKSVKGLLEEFKMKVRKNRTIGLDYVKKYQDKFSKDQIHNANQEVQQMHDDAVRQIEQIAKDKEIEIMPTSQQSAKKKK